MSRNSSTRRLDASNSVNVSYFVLIFCLHGSLEVLWRGRPECVWGARLGVVLMAIFENPCVYRPSPRIELLGGSNVCIMGIRLERDTFLHAHLSLAEHYPHVCISHDPGHGCQVPIDGISIVGRDMTTSEFESLLPSYG